MSEVFENGEIGKQDDHSYYLNFADEKSQSNNIRQYTQKSSYPNPLLMINHENSSPDLMYNEHEDEREIEEIFA